MAYSIQNIKSNLTGGGARSALFKVTFDYPAGISATSGEKLQFLCKASQIPASTINKLEVDYMGRKVKLAGTRPEFADWTVTVINDEDFAIRNDLENWMNFMNGHVDNAQIVNPLDYKTTGKVTQLSKDGSKLREYNFKGIFPTEIAQIDLSWDSEDLEEFEVTFSVDWWEVAGQTYPKGNNGTS
tara:strand:+ start:2672 stop:3226 length:555 start_codon:yes stop_codon:yes gene_type:complete